MWNGAEVCKSCRSRQELSNEYLLAKIRLAASAKLLMIGAAIYSLLRPSQQSCLLSLALSLNQESLFLFLLRTTAYFSGHSVDYESVTLGWLTFSSLRASLYHFSAFSGPALGVISISSSGRTWEESAPKRAFEDSYFPRGALFQFFVAPFRIFSIYCVAYIT